MANIEPFEKFSDDYDKWFVKHQKLYEAELKAVKVLMKRFENGIEIGVGTGRFAKPLGIKKGLEPSKKMAKIAKKRGIEVIDDAKAEDMPFEDEEFDFVLMVTTICFVDDVSKTIKEIWRILKKEGVLIIGFVDKNTPLGKKYLANKDKSRFYKSAKFFSSEEVTKLLNKSGFKECKAVQTLFGKSLDDMKTDIEDGFGKGAFVTIRCIKDDLKWRGGRDSNSRPPA